MNGGPDTGSKMYRQLNEMVLDYTGFENLSFYMGLLFQYGNNNTKRW